MKYTLGLLLCHLTSHLCILKLIFHNLHLKTLKHLFVLDIYHSWPFKTLNYQYTYKLIQITKCHLKN